MKPDKIPGHLRSVPANFLYAGLGPVLNALVPLVAYPYIARIFGPEHMGTLGVASSLSGFFLVIASLGLPLYGVRETARNRKDPVALGRLLTELFSLQIVVSVLSTAAYMLLVFSVPRYRAEPLVFAAFGATILVAGCNVDWFLQGIEEFRYMGIRNTVIKALSLALLFLVVRRREQYVLYSFFFAGFNASTIALNLRAASFHAKPSFQGVRPLLHLRPMVVFTITAAAATAYTSLDFLFLGLIADRGQSGFYNISIRLVRTFGFVTATLSGVLLPRLANIVSDDEQGFRRTLSDSLRAIMMIALPVAVGVLAVADDFILVFAGAQYDGAGASLRITAAIIPVAAVSNFLQVQVLVPRGRERPTLLSFAAGIVVGVAALYALVGPYGHRGAAAGMLAAECAVLAVQAAIVGRRELGAIVDGRGIGKYAAGAVAGGAAALLVVRADAPVGPRLAAAIGTGGLVYFLFLVFVRDDLFMRALGKLGIPGRDRSGDRGGAA